MNIKRRHFLGMIPLYGLACVGIGKRIISSRFIHLLRQDKKKIPVHFKEYKVGEPVPEGSEGYCDLHEGKAFLVYVDDPHQFPSSIERSAYIYDAIFDRVLNKKA